jgi:hypothetical protein
MENARKSGAEAPLITPSFQYSTIPVFAFQGSGFRLRGTEAHQRRLNGAIAIERLERLERSKLKEN